MFTAQKLALMVGLRRFSRPISLFIGSRARERGKNIVPQPSKSPFLAILYAIMSMIGSPLPGVNIPCLASRVQYTLPIAYLKTSAADLPEQVDFIN